MNRVNNRLKQMPGMIASGLMILVTTLCTYWGVAEMYHEDWWGSLSNALPYLAPVAITLTPTLIAFRWPRIGGALLIALGMVAGWFFGNAGVVFISAVIAIIGAAFCIDGWIVSRNSGDHSPRWRGRARYRLAVGAPALVVIVISAIRLPAVLMRIDDGDRSARAIVTQGRTLIWAPAGPGWNWKQDWGGYPGWQSLALYGVDPVGLGEKPGYGRRVDSTRYATAADMIEHNLCLFLESDGLTLAAAPVHIWRMPTTAEVVGALVHHGDSASCLWQGEFGREVTCSTTPDKESPLWATDVSVIYYWTADSYNDPRGYYVSFNGFVNAENKLGGNPRHGYRCVREP